MIRLAAMILAAALLVSACAADPFSFSIADELGLPTVDLSESDDPAVRASSEAWEATVATQDAEDALETGFANGDLAAVRRASNFRPADPRYPIFEEILTTQQTLDDFCGFDANAFGSCAENPTVGARRATLVAESQELIRAQNPGKSEDDIKRVWTEMRIEAMREAVERFPDSPQRDNRLREYCYGVTDFYPTFFAGADSTLFLATHAANGGLDLCK
jgi:hypothetical protein